MQTKVTTELKKLLDELLEKRDELSQKQIIDKVNQFLKDNENAPELEALKDREEVLEPVIENLKEYYYIDDVDTIWNNDDNTPIDDYRREEFNYFSSKQESEQFKIKQDLFRKIIRVRDFVNDGWKFDPIKMQNQDEWNYSIIDIDSDGFIDSYNKSGDESNNDQIFALPLTFENEEKAELFRKYVTDEEIKTFLLI